MDNSVKYRLVGTIVVLVVGLVILPPLLKAPLPELVLEEHIPPQPDRPEGLDVEMKQHDWTIGDVLADTKKPDYSVLDESANDGQQNANSDQEEEPSNSEQASAQIASVESDTETAEISKSDASEKPAEQKNTVADKKEASPIKQPLVDIKFDETGAPLAWTIQVGSFSNNANAKRLEAALLDKGYKAQIRTTSDAKLTRVYVGPSMNKKALEKEKRAIESAFNLKSSIVRYRAGE